MKEASKVIMGTTLAMAIALAIVLFLVLFLLAELYCSLLLHRRKTPPTTTPSASTATTATALPAPGVLLHPPRSFLFPNTPNDIDSPPPHEHLVYICNPVYQPPSGAHTPYETPESSPSHLGCPEDEYIHVCMYSPQLKPMSKLQPEACSVSLRDASSLATSPSVSDTNSNNGVSSSGSPNTSPSW